MYINKSQGMALSAAANIIELNHTLQQLITQLALYKLEIPGKVPKTEILIVYTNYWYRTTRERLIIGTEQHTKHSVICTGVVAVSVTSS